MKSMRLRHIILFLLMAVFVTPIRASIHTGYLLGGNYVYNNGIQWYLKLDCGEVSLTGNTSASSYYYDLKDYQGNVRMAVRSGSSSHFMTDYYPYGGVIRKGRIGAHHRLFIGKELDKMHGLNWYDFEARMYDPTLGRFMTMDPLAEKYYNVSPYSYCAGDPVNRFDPDGRDWFKTEGGNLCWQPDVHSQDDLQEGYNYIGESLEADGVLYRDDGTIIFPQECQAYERILYQLNRSRSNIHPLGKEQMAFILDDGSVMVMPDNWNDCETSTYKQTGITRGDHVLTDKHGEKFGYVAQIHTHTKGADKGLSLGDMKFAKADPDISVFVMHGDGNVYGGYYSSKRGGIDTWSNNPLLSIESLRRGKNSLRQRAVFYRNK